MLTVVRSISRESWILATICLVDLVLTCLWVQGQMAHEGNPLMNYYLQHGLAPFIAMKLTLVASPLLILEWARIHRPVFVRRVARLTIAAYLGVYGILFMRVNMPTILHEVSMRQNSEEQTPPSPLFEQLQSKLQQRAEVSVQQAAAKALTPALD